MRESRERQRERVWGVRGVFGSGEGVGTEGSDQVSQVYRAGGCLVSISLCTDSTRAHWKVAVSREERTHFVLLDDRQLRWLKDVMLVASRDNWKVPADCSTESARRTVTVSVGWRGGAKVLIVLERCKDGRNFYILVPADRDMEGWRKFLGVLCSRVKERGERQEMEVGEGPKVKSYAAMLAPKFFSKQGSSSIDGGEEQVIRVSNVGVEDRLRFLKTGLVFRIDALDGDLPDWGRLRRWMARFWGVPILADIRAMGDDLWLLCCTSEEEVERIISLNRWEPPGHKIRADRWCCGAGTSNVESKRGWVWAFVRGIPVHLRSEALMRDIKSFFGEGAVWSEVGCNLNEVRIRFQASFVAPKVIKIQFRERGFLLPVVEVGEGLEKEVLRLGERDPLAGEEEPVLRLGRAGRKPTAGGSMVGTEKEGDGEKVVGTGGVGFEEKEGWPEQMKGTGQEEVTEVDLTEDMMMEEERELISYDGAAAEIKEGREGATEISDAGRVSVIEESFDQQLGEALEDILVEEREAGEILDAEEEALCALSSKVAQLLEIRMPETTEVAENVIMETARSVAKRRKKSRLEREQQRIALDGDDVTPLLGRGKRNVGYVDSSSSLDELS
ncbi:hypothetical protein LINPERHAP1_LOCUS16307 [Linum perenne]